MATPEVYEGFIARPKGTTLRDVSAAEFIPAYAAHLKKSDGMVLPNWVDLVKTGAHKELAPYSDDWFYVRAAAVARKVYLKPGLGVGGLSRVFGGPERKGVKPMHFRNCYRGILRHIIQQLEKVGVIEIDEESGSGRMVTKAGRRDLDRIACTVASELVVDEPVAAEEDEDDVEEGEGEGADE
eukprot:CAMPEP_0116948124 /NCGR_PEP_ID=MMETSP0467-20121206/38117_1 /TAXON_ID=283647 /ORGANISM="Mesodinium pulex, Strain SPMC105" /LENGTH=182 /DNA_ID=CAMNT_0004632479 /DNA_START=44 /DNA_END=592 /DNA_ORIENTATION=+